MCLLAINVSCSEFVAMFLNRCVISSVSCIGSLLVSLFNTVFSVKFGFLLRETMVVDATGGLVGAADVSATTLKAINDA